MATVNPRTKEIELWGTGVNSLHQLGLSDTSTQVGFVKLPITVDLPYREATVSYETYKITVDTAFTSVPTELYTIPRLTINSNNATINSVSKSGQQITVNYDDILNIQADHLEHSIDLIGSSVCSSYQNQPWYK